MDRSAKLDLNPNDEHGQEGQIELPTPGNSRAQEAVHGNGQLPRESVDESDGQRRSLSLDEDGGTHFDSSDCLETVIKRGGPAREELASSGTFKDAFEDNDVIFNPAQRLNFDEDDDDEEEDYDDEVVIGDEDGNKLNYTDEGEDVLSEDVGDDTDKEDDNDEIALMVAQGENNEPVDGSDYLHHRPWVSGSDLVEESVPMSVSLAQAQNQNVRIIEGHDSSLLDDGNPSGPAVYGFNFLQPQMPPLPPVNPLHIGTANSDNEAQNLYDSLEREVVPSTYGLGLNEDIGDSNTSEYYSLMATNSQSSVSDSPWQQEELQRSRGIPPSSCLPLNQSMPATDLEQSPPRNFQLDHIKENQAFIVDGNVSAPLSVTDAQDVLNMEISEEGLLHNTQMYAQPPSSTCNAELEVVGIMSSSDRGDASFLGRQGAFDKRMYVGTGNQQASTDHAQPTGGASFNPRMSSSQQKNLALKKTGEKADTVMQSMQQEAKVAELSMDRRQAGAGSSVSFSDQNQKGNKTRAMGAVGKKAQIKRPAVQGSASAGDQKRSSSLASSHSVNSLPSSTNMASAGKTTAMNARANTQGGIVVSQKSKQKHPQSSLGSKPQTSTSVVNGHATARNNQGDSPLASRASSHTSLASVGSSNSRVGGVGKESHHFQGGQPVSLTQPLDIHPNSGGSLRADHSGQSKHSTMPTNPSSAHSLGIGGPQHAMHHTSSLPPPKSNQTHHMQEFHAGDQRSLHLPYSQAVVFNPQANSHGHSTSYLQHPHSIAAAGSVQAFQMTSFPPCQTLSPSGSESSHQSYNRDNVVTQMDAMKKVMNQSASSGHEMYSNELQNIEDVRSQLHNMLHVGTDNCNTEFSGLDHVETASELLTDQPVNRQLHFDTDSSSVFGNKTGEDMSEILENFPAFSSKMFSDVSGVSNRSDNHVHSENQFLRESLEKERYRRKHCEDQIQRLNSKLLEIQQQLAVAISTDKRKDSMIEQLDKQLAKVVEGWKKREADKDEAVKTLTEEKVRIEESLQRQQTMINNFEHDLAQTVDELKEERTKSSETIQGLRKELVEATTVKEEAQNALHGIKKKCDAMTDEWDAMKKCQALAEMRAQQAQEKLIKEQDSWVKKENEMSEKITQVKEANQKVMSIEKVKLEEQKKKREAAESETQELKAELKRLVLDTEQLVREKESQKMEVSIMEAKFESAQRKLEADLHAQMEKEIADQASEFHTRLENAMEEAGDRHRKQVSEIHARHQKDLERQMMAANEEREKKEEEFKKQISDLEARLSDVRSENSNLKQSKLKLESQRMEILTKLQFMMQSQWNEAVSLLVSTPQKKNVQGSFLSSSGGLHLSAMMGPPSNTPQGGSLSLGPSHVTVPSPPRSKLAADSQTSEGGRKSSTSSSGRERNTMEEMAQLDRVEEYLQKLNGPSDGAISGDDSQVSEISSAGVNANDRIFDNGGMGHSLQRPESRELYNQTQNAFLECDINSQMKMVHSSSQPSNHHEKPRTNLNGNVPSSMTLIPSAGFSLSQSFQALPIRSPQQMSRLPQGLDHGKTTTDHVNQFLSSSGQFFKNNPQSQGARQFNQQNHYPAQAQHQQQQQQPTQYHHQHHQRQEHLSVQSNFPANLMGQINWSKSSTQSNTFKGPIHHVPSDMSSMTLDMSGDCGDQASHLNYHNTDHSHNPNVFNSSNLAFVSSSPSGITPISSTALHKSGKEQNWSPDNSSVLPKLFVNQPSPERNQRGPTFTYNIESPRKRSSSQTSRTGDLNASLSPPIRQTAEKDQMDTHSEASSGMPDHSKLDANYSHLSEQMDDHLNRHEELQHYIQLLLQKAPGSVSIEPERDVPHDLDVLESSRDLTVDLDLNDTAQAQELTSQLHRLQELRERQQTSSVVSTNRQPHPTSGNRPVHHLTDYIGDNGVMNAQGLSEISQLLALYREQWESNPEVAQQVNTAGQLIEALRGVSGDISFESAPRNDQRKQPGLKGSPKGGTNKKPRDISSNKSKKKTVNQTADISIASTTMESSLEHSQNSSKGGNGPVTGRKNQDVIKEAKKAGAANVAKQTSKGGPVWK